MFSIAVNTSNIVTHAAAYLFECTVFLSLCVLVFVFSTMLSTPTQCARRQGFGEVWHGHLNVSFHQIVLDMNICFFFCVPLLLNVQT